MTSLLSHSLAEGRGVYINEVLQSNVNHVDEIMFLPDSWIELYNDSDEDVNLDGWTIVEGKKNFHSYSLNNGQYLPIDNLPWRQWQTTIIPAKGYLLIYCDEGNIGKHASFKLDEGKGHSLWLYNRNGELVDSLMNIPALIYPDISYGRVEGSDSLFSNFAFSTPFAPNQGEGKEVAPEVTFDQLGGLLTDTMFVEIGVEEDSLKEHIYYTLDGSEPTYSSLRYEEPIRIDESTVLRARVLKQGMLPRYAQTQSYLAPDHDIDLPIMSIVTDSSWFFGDTLGIYEGDKTYGLACWNQNGNYIGNRFRYISIEYFDDLTKESKVNQTVLARISGGCTRTYPHKSMIVKANKRLPQHSIPQVFWKEKPEISKTNSFMLRNSGQDYNRTMFRDAAVQHMLGGKVDLDIQAYQPCVVYINGKYFGIYNIRERSNEHWVEDNTDLEEDGYDAIENYVDVKVGTEDDLVKLLEGIKDSTLTYQDVVSQIDTVELVNHIVLEMFSGNIDWPQNNIMMWKPKKKGGKWRFLCKDFDHAVGLSDNLYADVPMLSFLFNKQDQLFEPYLSWTQNNWNEYKTRLMRYLLEDTPFSKTFIEKSILYLGTYLHGDSVAAVIDSFSYQIENEMFYHRDRWEGDEWYHCVSFLREEFQKRPDFCYQHLTDHYGLGEPVPTYISGEEGSDIKLFNMLIPGNKFDGKLFSGMPAQLKCSPGYYWQVNYKGMDGESYAVTMPDSVEFVASPAYLDLTLTAVNLENDLQEVVNVPECQWWVSDGELHLNAIGEPLAFAEVLSADGKCLWRGENVEQLELPLPVHQIFLLRYQTASKFGTFKIVN